MSLHRVEPIHQIFLHKTMAHVIEKAQIHQTGQKKMKPVEMAHGFQENTEEKERQTGGCMNPMSTTAFQAFT